MNIDFQNKKVLVRVDFNVPVNNAKEVTDDTRIRRALPTLKHILEHGGALILMSHFGRPQKKRLDDGSVDVEKFTLKQLIPTLVELISVEVDFADDCIGQQAIEKAGALKPGQILLLENTRFYKEETDGNEAFAEKLAALADVYVNDAFGAAHRAHASTAAVASFFTKENKSLGLLMQQEIENAEKVLNDTPRPFTAVIGGAKVSDKIQLLDKLIQKADNILIGGGMAYTFIRALEGKIGDSLLEEEYVALARDLVDLAASNGVKLLLPHDSVVSDKFSESGNTQIVESRQIPDEWLALDIGPVAIVEYEKVIMESKCILWNGPLGVFEMEKFSTGTYKIAQAIAASTEKGAFSLIGGGDSVAAVTKAGLDSKVSYISTGGGAMLEYFEGKELPGIKAINE
jgi:phosphoglycerate kinase